jgi:hypothetical protein
MAAVNNKLMLALGYRQYMAQGGDWGSLITRIQAIDYPENCVALHLNFVLAAPPSPWKHPIVFASIVLGLFSKSEKKLLDRMKWWGTEENGMDPSCSNIYKIKSSANSELRILRDPVDQTSNGVICTRRLAHWNVGLDPGQTAQTG